MAILNSWQRFDRAGLFGGQPWGTGVTGSATISADPNTRATVTGTATQTTSTIGSAILSNGDAVILHQTQGTGVGQWETNVVSSGGGTTSITWRVALKYTYGTGAQVIKVPQYTTATVKSHSVTAWNGTTGGVEVVCGKTSITVSGALSGASLGYRGGAGERTGTDVAQGYRGENTGGDNTTKSASASTTGGGGATRNGGGPSGGGGANATTGTSNNGSSQGIAAGSADLITL